jgi:Ala-tRNA(Pro) deacylase
MPPLTRDDLFRRLADLGIETTTVEHAAVFTVEESEHLHRDIRGAHTKNLFLKDAKDGLWLVVAEAHARVDLKRLSKSLGAPRFSFGRAGLLREVLGIEPGSVTAFAVVNDRERRVAVVVDRTLMGYEWINCHPLVNTATTTIARDDLIRFFRSCGHEPRIAALDGEATATEGDDVR